MTKPDSPRPDNDGNGTLRLVRHPAAEPVKEPSREERADAQVDQDLLRALQSLNRKLRRRLYHLNSLFRISIELAAVQGENELVHAFMLNVMGLLGAEVGAVLLSRPANPSQPLVGPTVLEPAVVRGLSLETARHLSRLYTQSSSDEFDFRHPVMVTQAAAAHPGALFAQVAEAVGIEVAMPLLHRGQRLGVTLLGKGSRRAPLSNADIEMLGLLSNLVAVALTNARMYRRMEEMSQTDGLTGLYNRRHLHTLLRNEVSRADRFKRHVSLAMIDIDHFKNYNDTLGHLAGDELLRIFSDLLRDSVRCTDFVARYGGEEFCVILPEVDREGAYRFCERLRRRIAQYSFPQGGCQPGGRVTVSIGCATYPEDASTPDELLAHADVAVYQAKESGRNRSVQFVPIRLGESAA